MRGSGSLKTVAERLIHLHGKIAGDLDVLFLIFADRHEVAVIDQNVGRHQDGIGEESRGSAHAARDLVFVGMRALEQSHRRDGGQNPGELGDLRHIGLAEERGPFRIEPAGEKIERHAPAVFPQRLRILQAGERVIIGDEIKRLALGLERDRRPHHAEIIPDVENAAGLNAGKNAHEISLPVVLSEVDAVTQLTLSGRAFHLICHLRLQSDRVTPGPPATHELLAWMKLSPISCGRRLPPAEHGS